MGDSEIPVWRGIPAFGHNPNSSFLGFPMSQNRYAIPAWSHLFELVKPARIIEIGTNVGGMTCLLAIAAKNLGAKLYTCDLHTDLPPDLRAWLGFTGSEYIAGDVFAETKERLCSLVASTGISVVLCDGGDKKREVAQFAPYLKTGDIIAAHDFHADHDWPWREIEYAEIQDAAEQYHLVENHHELFKRTGWRVFTRES